MLPSGQLHILGGRASACDQPIKAPNLARSSLVATEIPLHLCVIHGQHGFDKRDLRFHCHAHTVDAPSAANRWAADHSRAVSVRGDRHVAVQRQDRLPSSHRQTPGVDRSILHLLGLDLAVRNHSTLSHRAKTVEGASSSVQLPAPGPFTCWWTAPACLCGPGEWLVERHGSRIYRSWKSCIPYDCIMLEKNDAMIRLAGQYVDT